jgi:hypothetical protein
MTTHHDAVEIFMQHFELARQKVLSAIANASVSASVSVSANATKCGVPPAHELELTVYQSLFVVCLGVMAVVVYAYCEKMWTFIEHEERMQHTEERRKTAMQVKELCFANELKRAKQRGSVYKNELIRAQGRVRKLVNIVDQCDAKRVGVCELCHKGYDSRNQLFAHLREVHYQKEARVAECECECDNVSVLESICAPSHSEPAPPSSEEEIESEVV